MTRKGLTRKKKNIILTCICILLTAALLACVGVTIWQNINLKKANQTLVELEQNNSALTSQYQQEREGYESQLNEKDKQIAEKDNKINSLNSRVMQLEKLKAEKKAKPKKPILPAVSVDTSAVKSIKEAEVIRLAAQNKMANGNKICFLTFDDGPNSHTVEILNTLKQYNVKATFFVTQQTDATKKNKNLIKRAYDEGHTIAVHSYSHNYKQIYQSEAAYLADFNQMNGAIKDLIGKEANIFRFPGGSSNTVSRDCCTGIMSKLIVTMTQKGYQYFDWNVDSDDGGSARTAKKVASNVLSGCKNKTSACVLMHDKEQTAKALPEIIEGLKAQGFIFLPLTVDNYGYHHGLNN